MILGPHNNDLQKNQEKNLTAKIAENVILIRKTLGYFVICSYNISLILIGKTKP